MWGVAAARHTLGAYRISLVSVESRYVTFTTVIQIKKKMIIQNSSCHFKRALI